MCPSYDYRCPSCNYEQELVHPMSHCDRKRECPKCNTGMRRDIVLVAIQPPQDSGWEFECGGRGRYISQLELPLDEKVDAGLDIKRSDPYAFCRSRSEIVEKAARRGKKILSGAPRATKSLSK